MGSPVFTVYEDFDQQARARISGLQVATAELVAAPDGDLAEIARLAASISSQADALAALVRPVWRASVRASLVARRLRIVTALFLIVAVGVL